MSAKALLLYAPSAAILSPILNSSPRTIDNCYSIFLYKLHKHRGKHRGAHFFNTNAPAGTKFRGRVLLQNIKAFLLLLNINFIKSAYLNTLWVIM